MRVKSVFIFLFIAIATAKIGWTRTLYDVNVPETKTVAGQELKLNGAGLRTVFILHVKAYVASFYSPAPLKTTEQVYASPGPLHFDFTFLKGVSQDRVTDAWVAQFRESADFTYAGFEKDRDVFIKAFGPLKKFGVESVEIEKDETRVYDAGVLKTTIKGRNFQKLFLSLWFGSKPVMPSLKAALLGHVTPQ